MPKRLLFMLAATLVVACAPQEQAMQGYLREQRKFADSTTVISLIEFPGYSAWCSNGVIEMSDNTQWNDLVRITDVGQCSSFVSDFEADGTLRRKK